MINIFYCNYCGWKKNIKNLNDIDLVEIKNSHYKNKKYRCPKCGRLISYRQSKIDPQEELNYNKKNKQNEEKIKNWIKEVEKYREDLLKNDTNTNNNT